MEGAMLNIRIVTAGAVILVMAAGSAAAQTATGTAPGKPIPLLTILKQPDKTKTKLHAANKLHATKMSRRVGKIHTAAKGKWTHRTAIAKAAAPVVTDAVTADAAPAPQPASSFTAPAPNEFVVGGRTVQVASPDNVNDMDLAANSPNAPAATTTAAAVQSDVIEPAPAAEAVVAAQAPRSTSPVGSASWFAQVLAALGGAVAAGSAAWFLIGSAPQRTYG
jgi:hypothetical protein